MSIIDQTNDAGYAHLVALLKTHPGAFDLVKTAAVGEDYDALPDDAFAWPGERKYPIHAPHHAVLSHLYAKLAEVPVDVQTKIAEALDAYEIDVQVISETRVKVAEESDDEFLFPAQKLYRVKTAEDLFRAQDRLLEQVTKLTPEQRAEGFGRLYKRAQELGQPLDPRSYQYAGTVETDLREVRASLDARISATRDDSTKTAFAKLASTLGNYPRRLSDRATQVKLAQFIGDLDQKGDVQRKYDRGIPDPIRTVFNTDRIIKIGDQMVELGSQSFPLTQLAAMDPHVYGDVLGPEIVPEISTAAGGNVDPAKLMQILPTLPADLKAMLGQKLRTVLGG